MPLIWLDLKCRLQSRLGAQSQAGVQHSSPALLPNVPSLVQVTENLGANAWERPESLVRQVAVHIFPSFHS